MDLITIIVQLVVLGIIFSLLWYYLVPEIPPPFHKGVKILIILLAVLVLLWIIGWVPNPVNLRIGR